MTELTQKQKEQAAKALDHALGLHYLDDEIPNLDDLNAVQSELAKVGLQITAKEEK